ncbi:MAG: hypothetical protein J0H68_09210 [Sphingobacteriia bacterium]|nr:hypothetical protein [Sphingobacteriia bacterium]
MADQNKLQLTREIRNKLAANNLSDEEYKKLQYEFIKANEGAKCKVYLDSQGIKTVGIGFNLENPNAKQELINAFAEHNINVSFEDVFNGKRVLNDKEIKVLFDYSTRVRENELRRTFGEEIWKGKLTPNERLAIEDLYYTGGNSLVGKQTSFFKNIKEYASTHDQKYLDAAIHEVTERSNPKINPKTGKIYEDWEGKQNRREVQGEMLKTYETPAYKDYIKEQGFSKDLEEANKKVSKFLEEAEKLAVIHEEYIKSPTQDNYNKYIDILKHAEVDGLMAVHKVESILEYYS